MIPLPEGLSGDALFQAIYDAMWSAHPYDAILEHIGYHGPCEDRSAFYRSRDKTSQFRRSTKFLDLFHDYDREAARLWLEKTFPPQKHTEVLRDTGGSLFSSVIRMAKEAGEFGRAEAILDYILPCEHEDGIHEKVKLTAYEFDFQPYINYGCEGIYIDCYLMGKFDESGRFRHAENPETGCGGRQNHGRAVRRAAALRKKVCQRESPPLHAGKGAGTGVSATA